MKRRRSHLEQEPRKVGTTDSHGSRTGRHDGANGNRRLAVFYPYRWWSTFAQLEDLLGLLSEAGWTTDLFVPPSDDPAEGRKRFGGASVHADASFLFDSAGVAIPRLFRRHGGRPVQWLVLRVFRPTRRLWHRLSARTTAKPEPTTQRCCIGFDQEGLSAAMRWAAPRGMPIVYWSLEIAARAAGTSSHESAAKRREIRLQHQTAFTVVQDPWRAELLQKETGPLSGAILLVPNAPRGPARSTTSDWATHVLGADPGLRLIVSPGILSSWAGPEELIRCAAVWPKPYTLLLHSRRRLSTHDAARLKALIATVGKGRTILSDIRLTRDEYRDMLGACFAGLAYYDADFAGTRNDNVYTMGRASGKVADFLQAGLPVIASALPGLEELLRSHRCGTCVSDPSEIVDALALVEAEHEAMAHNACRCFNEELELSRAIMPLVAALEKGPGSGP